jgi:hypothetical protein
MTHSQPCGVHVRRFFSGDYYEGSWAAGLRDGAGMQQVSVCSRVCVCVCV